MYKDFLAELLIKTRIRLGGEYAIELKEILKFNENKKTGIIIHKKSVKEEVVPVLYVEELYEEYKIHKDISASIETLINTYLKEYNCAYNVLRGIMNWEKIRKFIYPVLISKDYNNELMKKLVHREYMDMEICYIIRFPWEGCGEEGRAVVYADESMMKIWETDADTMHEAAINNMKNDGYEITDIYMILKEAKDIEEVAKEDNIRNKMYVMTNRDKSYGAAGLLLVDKIRNFAKSIGAEGLFIIPSSIHEVIMFPDNGNINVSDINMIIRQVNRDEVEKRERLAEHAYYYDGEKNEMFELVE